MSSSHDQAPWAASADDVLRGLDVDPARGLSSGEAEARLRRYGPNVLRSWTRQSVWRILANQLKSVIVLLLVAAAIVSAAFGDWPEAGAVLAVLVVNTAIGFATERQAVRSMESLRELGTVTGRVRRDGKEVRAPADQLVPGDIVILEGGDVITADLRLIEASKLAVDESILTGESIAVTKTTDPLPEETALADRRNILFKGTALTRGSAHAVVVATGMRTELGRIALLVAEADDEVTPLERRLERLGRRLIIVALVIAAIASTAGILSGRGVLLMIETGVALAVAAIPEGLPIVATMALARGMWRLAQKNAHVRSLAAVETLGTTSVILVDKTGTLTENRMTVTRFELPDLGRVDVSGEGLAPTGSFRGAGGELDPAREPLLRHALEVGVLCNDATFAATDHGETFGDPLEVAFLVAAAKGGLRRRELVSALPEVREEAFDPAVKMMATYHQHDGAILVAVKGAAEAVLAACSMERGAGGTRPLDDATRHVWLERADALAGDGLRVLALASKQVPSTESAPYADLEIAGLAGMLDPPRQGVREAVSACRRAGVRVVMATGDQSRTARVIAAAVGLADADAAVVHGDQVDEVLADAGALQRTRIFARVDPEQKIAIVGAYQRTGAVVAMTGDGVNDAPALKKADIGIAMGERGTQVAREAADMVLRDDSLASIVLAVRQGRVIYGNIRQFVVYLLSCNVAEIGVITIAALTGLPLPLLPLQILFLNLVTDVFPALALAFGEGDPNTMERSPRDRREAILTRRHWRRIIAYGALITTTVLVVLVFALERLEYGAKQAVTISFLTLGLAQLWHVFNVRRSGSSFLGNDVVRNPWVWGSIGLCALLLLATVFVPPLADVLDVAALDGAGWGIVVSASLVPWGVGQLWHAIARPRRDRNGPTRDP